MDMSFIGLLLFAGLAGFAGVVFTEQPVEDIEAAGPELFVEAEPLVGAGEGAGFEPADMRAALHFTADEAGALKRLDVLGGRRQRHGKGLGKLAHRAFATAQG